MAVRTITGSSKQLAAERGCLVIADISGYTGYVVESPLEQAEDVLTDVTVTVSAQLAQVLSLNKQEGDAVFGYALAGSLDGTMLLDTIEQAYFAFRNRLAGIQHATSCDCNACAKLPDLDLKFVAHFGDFVRRPSGGGEELTGSAVIVAHRLLKNQAADRVGGRGYALLTEACITALGLEQAALGLREHFERYEDVGEVRAYVSDLEARWQEETMRRRVMVGAREAAFELDTVLPVPPAAAWEYLTAPQKRLLWQGDEIEESGTGGRRAAGSSSVCVDGRLRIYEEILDWRPFKYFTERRSLLGGKVLLTTELQPHGEGTRVRIRGKPEGGGRGAWWRATARVRVRKLRAAYARLESLFAEEA